jgi:hypothetical protein
MNLAEISGVRLPIVFKISFHVWAGAKPAHLSSPLFTTINATRLTSVSYEKIFSYFWLTGLMDILGPLQPVQEVLITLLHLIDKTIRKGEK